MITVLDEVLQNIRMNMCLVRGGVFDMGDRHNMYHPLLSWRGINCVPVKLDDFHLSSKLITFGEWDAVMKGNVRTDEWANKPVANISWNDAQLFIERINNLLQWDFRLPTEAEWEYAARGGEFDQDYIFAGDNILNQYAWFDQNSGYKLHDVGTKRPNLLGLYDMCGNAWEWCQDWYEERYHRTGLLGIFNGEPALNPQGPRVGFKKVIRGGSYRSSEARCWVFYRTKKSPASRYSDVGFRIAY